MTTANQFSFPSLQLTWNKIYFAFHSRQKKVSKIKLKKMIHSFLWPFTWQDTTVGRDNLWILILVHKKKQTFPNSFQLRVHRTLVVICLALCVSSTGPPLQWEVHKFENGQMFLKLPKPQLLTKSVENGNVNWTQSVCSIAYSMYGLPIKGFLFSTQFDPSYLSKHWSSSDHLFFKCWSNTNYQYHEV